MNQYTKIEPCTFWFDNFLGSCRSLVSRLEEVNPRKMKHEEKLAFWINVHNSLAMHVQFVNLIMHGISQNSQNHS